MEKRIIIAFILSFAVLYGFSWLYPTQPADPIQVSEQIAPEPASAPQPPVPVAISETPTIASSEGQQAVREVRGEKAEDIAVETDLYTVNISNVEGVLRSFKLKDYKDATGNPIELISSTAGANVGWPLAIVTGDPKTDETLAGAMFAASREGNRITLEYGGGSLNARKVLEFSDGSYHFSFESEVFQDGRAIPHYVVWRGVFGDQSIPRNGSLENVVYGVDGDFGRINVAGIEPQELSSRRVGVEDQYFLFNFILPEMAQVKVDKKEFAGADSETVITPYLNVRTPPSGAVRVYAGPKDQRWLQQTDPELVRVIDYGFFEVITRPLVLALLWIHSYIGNFGWAIIILTIFINLALFPLRLKQQVSMQKMQKIQPQMRTLQDKYKKLKANDPKRAQIQAEMMGLYKEHGVNPMGGCLPLLLQMPFFFAFWNMLSVSIEMRQAPWLLWIRDLSQHDPFYVLPILMAITMFLMQRMMPSTTDPAQAKIMMFMPLMFTFFFLWAQSGLVLYWLTSNVVGIGQQMFINKYWAPRTEPKERSGKKGQSSE
jgi:YidC/Oxa1 family membrane protein insertase